MAIALDSQLSTLNGIFQILNKFYQSVRDIKLFKAVVNGRQIDLEKTV